MKNQDKNLQNIEDMDQQLEDQKLLLRTQNEILEENDIEMTELRRTLATMQAQEQPKENWGMDKRGRLRNLAGKSSKSNKEVLKDTGQGVRERTSPSATISACKEVLKEPGQGVRERTSPSAAISACETGEEGRQALEALGLPRTQQDALWDELFNETEDSTIMKRWVGPRDTRWD
jgi:hypothetical protein